MQIELPQFSWNSGNATLSPWLVEGLVYAACACLGVIVYCLTDHLVQKFQGKKGKTLPSPPVHAILGHIPAVAKYIAKGERHSLISCPLVLIIADWGLSTTPLSLLPYPAKLVLFFTLASLLLLI